MDWGDDGSGGASGGVDKGGGCGNVDGVEDGGSQGGIFDDTDEIEGEGVGCGGGRTEDLDGVTSTSEGRCDDEDSGGD